MHCERKLKLRQHNTSYCLIEVVTKAGLTVVHSFSVKTTLTLQNFKTYITYSKADITNFRHPLQKFKTDITTFQTDITNFRHPLQNSKTDITTFQTYITNFRHTLQNSKIDITYCKTKT